MRFIVTFILTFCLTLNLWAQGPFAPPVGTAGSIAIAADSSIITGWASNGEFTKGWLNIANKSAGKVNFGGVTQAIGKSDKKVVSLGDSGVITLSFSQPIVNVPGPDFAIFENSFDDQFLELAFVEVSSNGVDFYRFPAVSLTDTFNQIGSFGFIDATDIYNLAGKYRGGYGTPFDLQELSGTGVDVTNITHVRIIDVIGSVDGQYATRDSSGRKINDPWPTEFLSSGFDLDAVAMINQETTGISISGNKKLSIYPNPTLEKARIDLGSETNAYVFVYDMQGDRVAELHSGNRDHLMVNKKELGLVNGIYWIQVIRNKDVQTLRIIFQ